jgi:hypothetical protein
LRRDPDARRYTFPNDACDDLAFERSEDDHSKIYLVQREHTVISEPSPTIPFTFALPVPVPINPSEALRRSYMQMHSPTFCTTWYHGKNDNAEYGVESHLVRVFLIDPVFEVLLGDLVVSKSVRRDLNKIVEFGLAC